MIVVFVVFGLIIVGVLAWAVPAEQRGIVWMKQCVLGGGFPLRGECLYPVKP